MFRFAYPWTFVVTIPLFIVLLIYRFWWYNMPVYSYPLSTFVARLQTSLSSYVQHVLSGMRALALFFLVLLMGRPQWVDVQRDVRVDGVDIMLALDVSNSMQIPVDMQSRTMRIEVAKQEALRFIEKRVDDAIGVVLFAHDVITRCPLTLDKSLLRTLISGISIGFINGEGTALFSGLATAASRLANSPAKGKVVILLTDGCPSGDMLDLKTALGIAKRFGVTVYTIGIGEPMRNFWGQIEDIDMSLLSQIAQETGGKAFRAGDGHELRAVYEQINELEKTERSVTMYNHYHEAGIPLLWLTLLLLVIESLLRITVWRRLWWR